MPVQLHIDTKTLAAAAGVSLFECAERVGVRVPTSCHKNGKCRECLVEVTEGMACLSPPTPEEKHLGEGFRLACRARIAADSGTLRCHTLRRGEMRIEEEADGVACRLQGTDPAVRRQGDRVLLDGQEVARSRGPLHGLAVDLGTTTVVVRLIDLETGTIRDARSFENPQRFGGSDVMARIRYDTDHPGRLLQRVLLGYLSHAIEELDGDPETIYEIVVAGNSTMRDLFFGLDVHSIGQRPYRSLVEHELRAGERSTTALTLPAARLRLPVHPRARVYGLPLISGHVGADAASALLATGLADEDHLAVLMDIGTNTELIVGRRGELLAASCPAGPAFEGGLISCGMPGLRGAIESVRIRDDGSVAHRVIGETPPQGVCGSGLVDLLSELRRTERMNELGRFTDESSSFPVDAERGLRITEEDISQLAQAKGANVAGLRIGLQRYGVEVDDIEVFYLAGGFGKYLSVDSARRIGLIPNLPDEKIRQVGNTSIEGATLALLSASRRRELEDVVKGVTHVELETDEDFFDHFVDGCQFVPVGGRGA
ncbi:MAG: ASKHA domain-containing protein [Planctomycetota bacterium]|nr:ASKHA domain-containing protein [Planctomycetota bacterium]